MIKRARQIANLMLAATAAAFLAGCAGGPEFQGVPQEGAAKTGTYPTFGRMPKAATVQITAEEKEQITSTLDSDRTRLAATRSANAGVTPAQAAALRKQAQEETDATLREIEAGQE
ncbi:hypothetical protein KUG47_09985 [Falsochrobactrum sp. TDYN1]|uniref:Uncharacterized protein n=1 Tax=Falsochrobactrum tianjinense TaxID=2706015 RepID=A0A949PS13_9HYPH|nr:hypothetical protein [Falsochrobactrum sp. TDYN1]MBV2143825.1 hypothetical protein [Falsochrobactrum sp. TDYN1]